MADSKLPSVDKVDPELAWQPWKPDEKQPWSLKWAGHLYRRAAFGATHGELKSAVDKGFAETLNLILAGGKDTDGVYELIANKNVSNPFELRKWWLWPLGYSPHPLLEKMTLFWHNHFVSSIGKVGRPTLMQNQNMLLRKHALGKFPTFLLKVSQDAAMLIYLDSNSNTKGKPNENYAREVMELFSLGLGNYTERDIQEAARAFTGWHTDGSNGFDFNDRFHDFDEKTFLGKKGAWNGDDIVRIIVEQPACARFLVRKLYHYFISELVDPPAALLEPLADSFRKSGCDIADLVGTILRSRHFFSEYAYRQRVKSPVEFALGAIWAVTVNREEIKLFPLDILAAKLEAMGQQLFAPPNVKGWPGGKSWLNTSTVLARHNFAQQVASGHLEASYSPGRFGDLDDDPRQPPQRPNSGPPSDPNMDVAQLVAKENVKETKAIVEFLLGVFLQGEVSAKARENLVAFLADGKSNDKERDNRIRETAHAIMTMPEYQLA